MCQRHLHLCAFVGALVGLMLSATSKLAAETPHSNDANVVTVSRNDRVLFRGAVVPLDRLAETIKRSDVAHGEIVVRTDGLVSYGAIRRILDALGQSQSRLLDAPGPGYREQKRRSTR